MHSHWFFYTELTGETVLEQEYNHYEITNNLFDNVRCQNPNHTATNAKGPKPTVAARAGTVA